MNNATIAYLLDDDIRIRESLTSLFVSCGRKLLTFANAPEYLAYPKPEIPGCLILDLELPGMSGLELQAALRGTFGPPIIVLTGHGDVSSSVKAMKAGAVEFLQKPFDPDDLIVALDFAINLDREARLKREELKEIGQRYANLSPREKDVLPLVVSGLLNKQTADKLGLCEITVRIHRSNIMRKMKADSLADLVRLAGKLDVN